MTLSPSPTSAPPPDVPPLRRVLLFGADFGAAWLSYSFAMIFAHPMDTLRVRYQTLNQRP